MDLCLKADSQEAMDEMLLTAGLIDEEGNPTEGVDLDRIGTISRVTGYDDEGEPIIKTYPGYHANVRVAWEVDEAEFDEFLVVPPEVPFRVWA